jgi:hypothetical protein
MKVRIEYVEWSRRVVELDAPHVTGVRQQWQLRDQALLDLVTDGNVEVDGGIDWDSALIEPMEDSA